METYLFGYIEIKDEPLMREFIANGGYPVEILYKPITILGIIDVYQVVTWIKPPKGNIWFTQHEFFNEFWGAYNSLYSQNKQAESENGNG